MEPKMTPTTQSNIGQKNVAAIALSGFKIYYEVTLVKSAQYWKQK
jgi:hypothetical protein